MSTDFGNLCSIIIEQVFGEAAQKVVDCLFVCNSRSMANIIKTTGLSVFEVQEALAQLVHYELVTFVPAVHNRDLPEYSLKREEMYFILRYPRYIHIVRQKYQYQGVAILDKILYGGSASGTELLYQCMLESKEGQGTAERIETFRDVLIKMIRDNYLIKLPVPIRAGRTTSASMDVDGKEEEESDGEDMPQFDENPLGLFTPPELDLKFVMEVVEGKAQLEQAQDIDINWTLNFRRFHQDIRDEIMVNAIERKLGKHAAECFTNILQTMYVHTDPWVQHSSNPFTYVEVKQKVEKNSNNLELMKYLEQYVTLIADDSLGFLRRTGDMGGGQYVVDFERGFQELGLACIERVITEKFGSKASRIFRVIRSKKYIEQEDLQKEAMIPSKEAKFLAYSLFQEQFIHIRTIRKAGGGNNGMAKSFYLFHIREKQIIKMLLDTCYKALYNEMTRTDYEKMENKRLIEKSEKLEGIVTAMRERGDTEEYIAEIMETLTPPEKEILEKVKRNLQTLLRAEVELDENVFLLQMYLYHTSGTPRVMKT